MASTGGDTMFLSGLVGMICRDSWKEGQLKQSKLGITMAAYKGCSDAFADTFDGMDISPFVDVEQKGTLVFRPYSKSMALWSEEISQALVNV